MPNILTDLKKQDDDALRDLASVEIDASVARLRFFARTTSVDPQARDEAILETLMMKLAEMTLELGIDVKDVLDGVSTEYNDLAKEAGVPEAVIPEPPPSQQKPVAAT